MDGSILVNIRNQNSYHCHCRMVTRSYDGAETFPMENLYLDETLIEPACAAGMVYHKNVLFFSNPKSTTESKCWMYLKVFFPEFNLKAVDTTGNFSK